jgi:hypothetical protein
MTITYLLHALIVTFREILKNRGACAFPGGQFPLAPKILAHIFLREILKTFSLGSQALGHKLLGRTQFWLSNDFLIFHFFCAEFF